METSKDEAAKQEREMRRRKIDEILKRIDAIPLREDVHDLEWDENGLPI